VDFGGDINTWEKAIEEVKAAKFGQNNRITSGDESATTVTL
jgi:hypothetical protein